MVAVGPYTPSDSMKYEGLTDLLKVVSRDKPDICILIGPFIEATHKMIENGEIAETFDDMFKQQMDLIVRTSGELQTQFVLVPSYKDVHGHLVFPTPPYSDIPYDRLLHLIILKSKPNSKKMGGFNLQIFESNSSTRSCLNINRWCCDWNYSYRHSDAPIKK